MRFAAVVMSVFGSIGVLALSSSETACLNSLTVTCETESCTGNSNTYQICDSAGGSLTYKFGDQSCSGSASNETQLENCTNAVDVYCGIASATEDGGISTTGPGTGTSTPCTYVVSGAATASASCTVSAAYDSSKSGIAFAVTSSTGAMSFGATLAGQTTLTPGTYTLANVASGAGAEYLVGTSSVYDMCTTTSNCTDAQGNPSSPQGSFTLTITSAGPASEGVLWSSPEGSLVLTLPPQLNGTASGTVTVNVTL